ncbi:MAG: AMP-binding protein [Alphaproteobacteria bacterium]|nr:AMP-binding protein [Alphaproteobacteria bacterium]
MKALARQIANARSNTKHYARLFRRVDPAAIDGREALAALPVTRKSELKALQAAAPPFGGLAALDLSLMAHVYQSPGPLYEPDGALRDYWRFARSMWAAGVRPGMLVHNTFSYHLTPAGMMVESGARAIGCPVFPGGVGNTELQVQAMAQLRPRAYGGTPSFLKILLDKAKEMKLRARSLERAIVGGEALPPSLRKELSGHGLLVLQNYGTADLGLIAYESPALEGLIVDEGVIVEIVRPGTGEPVPDGEVGEVVVTSFNPVHPLIRFATGDLSAVLAGTSPCGRTNMRIKGWMGRADQTTKIKGMFVHPAQLADVAQRHREVLKARLEVTSRNNLDAMTLRCEVAEAGPALAAKIAETLQAVCKLRGEVELVRPGSLPNDGKVIADLRKYD